MLTYELQYVCSFHIVYSDEVILNLCIILTTVNRTLIKSEIELVTITLIWVSFVTFLELQYKKFYNWAKKTRVLYITLIQIIIRFIVHDL